MADYQAVQTLRRSIGGVDFEYAINAGPRIVGASTSRSPEFMAKLTDEGISHPAIGVFRFIGGHRLWRSPEQPAITYQPDSEPVDVQEDDEELRLVGAADSDGIVKTVTIREERGSAVLHHTLVNEGPIPVVTAPWAITQVATGGIAYLPLTTLPRNDDGVLPNRNIVLWPYTDLAAPEITITDTEISIHASARRSKMKVGVSNHVGWIAYYLDGYVLVKWSATHDDRRLYSDMGASIQCYRDERFLEIETVAPLEEVSPGEATTHKEIWRIIEVADRSVGDVLRDLPADPERPALL